jgi:hypothetical protein
MVQGGLWAKPLLLNPRLQASPFFLNGDSNGDDSSKHTYTHINVCHADLQVYNAAEAPGPARSRRAFRGVFRGLRLLSTGKI